MKIFKYTLKLDDEQTIEMPSGAIILTCQEQSEKLQLWAIVDPDKPLEKRRFEIIGTGNPFKLTTFHKHISTVQLRAFVWHVFEIIYA